LLSQLYREAGRFDESRAVDAQLSTLLAAADADPNVRDAALWMLRDIALDAFEGIPEVDSLAAVDALTDQKTLAGIAKTAVREEVALRALSRISDPRAHGSIARHAQVERVRLRWISPRRNFYLFTSAETGKANSLSPLVLRGYVRAGRIRSAESAPLFERVVGDMMRDLGAPAAQSA
jgi:hypothetical protein